MIDLCCRTKLEAIAPLREMPQFRVTAEMDIIRIEKLALRKAVDELPADEPEGSRTKLREILINSDDAVAVWKIIMHEADGILDCIIEKGQVVRSIKI